MSLEKIPEGKNKKQKTFLAYWGLLLLYISSSLQALATAPVLSPEH